MKLRGFAVSSLWLVDYNRSTQETIKAKKVSERNNRKITINNDILRICSIPGHCLKIIIMLSSHGELQIHELEASI